MKFGQRIGAFARAHTGCSQLHDVARYVEAVVPPGDLPPGAYYLHNAALSTCALFGSRCLEVAEEEALACGATQIPDQVIAAKYVISAAVANVENVGAAHHAIDWYAKGTHPTEPFEEGDIPIINGPPWGVHVIVCTSDAVLLAGGRWRTTSAEGGQGNGGVEAFVHDWEVRADGNMYPGPTSQRRVIAVVRARRFGYDDAETVGGDVARDAAPPETAPTWG